MSPPGPKRPPKPPPPPGNEPSRTDPEPPLLEEDVTPLQADDPRPQRVPQLPIASRRPSTAAQRQSGHAPPPPAQDREMPPRYRLAPEEGPVHVPAFLYVERGPGAGQLIPVKQGSLVIGRSAATELRLQHPSVSRRHAEISRQDERFSIKDLESQNGTYVRRKKIAGETVLQFGDEIVLGNAVLKLRGPPRPPLPQRALAAALGAPGGVIRKAPVGRVALLAGLTCSLFTVGLTWLVLRSSFRERTPVSRPLPMVVTPPRHQLSPMVIPVGAAEEQTATAPALERAEEAPAAKAPPAVKVAAPVTKAAAPATKAAAPAAKAPVPAKAPVAAEEAPDASHNRAEVMARYEEGNAASALSLARRTGQDVLARELETFQNLHTTARKALAAGQQSEALRALTAAVTLDDRLAQGWGVYGPELRHQLADLHTRIGLSALEKHEPLRARESFVTALRYQPDNARARTQLELLTPPKVSAPPKAPVPAPAAKAPAPAPTPARSAPSSRAAKIDAAFQDGS